MKEKIEKFKEERIGGKKRDFVETVKVEGGGDLMDTRGSWWGVPTLNGVYAKEWDQCVWWGCWKA